MAGPAWHYVLKFIITGDAAVGKSSLLIRLTDQRFLANPDPTLGVEFGSKLITLPEEDKIVKLQCWDTAGTESFRAITRSYYRGAAGCLLVYDVTSRKSFLNAKNWLADVREHADPNLTCILVGNKVDLCGEDVPPPPPPRTSPSAESADVTASTSSTSTLTSSQPRASSPSSASASADLSTAPIPSTTTTATPTATTTIAAKHRPREVSREEGAAWAAKEGLLFVEASAKSGVNVEQAFVDASRDILRKVQRGAFGAADGGGSAGVKLNRPNGPGSGAQQVTLDGSGRGAARGGCCGS